MQWHQFHCWKSNLCLTELQLKSPPPLAVYQEFDRLLEEQSPIEAYIEWLDTMVDRCVVKVRQQPTLSRCQLFFSPSFSSPTQCVCVSLPSASHLRSDFELRAQ